MNGLVHDLLDRLTSLAPMPPEAYPGRWLGRIPGVRPLVELAWKEMAITMFAAGTLFGLAIAVLILVAIALQVRVPAILRGLADARG